MGQPGSSGASSRLKSTNCVKESRGCWKAAQRRTACGDSSVQTTISARHGHLSAATQAKITEKVEVVRKFFDRVTAISVMADLEHRERAILELRVRAEHHDEFVAIAEADTIF